MGTTTNNNQSGRRSLMSSYNLAIALLLGLCFCWTTAAAAVVVVDKSYDTNVFSSEDDDAAGDADVDAVDPARYQTSNNSTQPQEPNILKDRQSQQHQSSQQQQRIRRKNPFQSRIIGGSKATKGRYPYSVSILTAGGSDSMAPACGGTLIAPDLILTAAHCRQSRLRTVHIGRYDRSDASDPDFEVFTILEQIPHPNYHPDRLDHDIMLLKLSGASVQTVVSLNRDPTIPAASGDDNNNSNQQQQLIILGFGVTQINGGGLLASSSASPTLQMGIVQHVPNDVCEQSTSPGIDDTYQGKITKNMVCALGDGVDACQGDSGSALILSSKLSSAEDIQVGVTSWGFRCAHPDFPGVYSRVSAVWDWIAAHVCETSSQPPAAFKCHAIAATTETAEGVDLVDQQQQQSSSISVFPPKLVPVTLKITFDSYASEIRWRLKDELGNFVASVPFDSYANGRLRAIRTFFLPQDKTYYFMIEDRYRDGLSPGNYMLTAGQAGSGRLLLFGKGDFGTLARHDFQVPALDEGGDSTNSDDWNSEVTASLQTQVGTVPIGVILQLDDNPTETGWMLERVGFRTEVVARMPTGAYRTPMEEVTFSLDLEEDELYRFTLLDTQGNGIDEGYVQLFFGKRNIVDKSASTIFDHDGSFGFSLDHSFLASIADISESIPPDSSSDREKEYLTLEMRMDLYPEEIGFQVRADTLVGAVAVEKRASNVVFFRPPSFYNMSHTNQIVREQIPLPQGDANSRQHYTLIMIDAFGDGLCCNWPGRLSNTGYTLYKGEPANGEVLVTSLFSSTAREKYSFSIVKDDKESENVVSINTVPASVLPVGEVVVRVVIRLDSYPEQTGYSIIDVEGRTVANVLPGSYRDENATVAEDYVLAPGIYTLTVTDSHGDGIATKESTDAAYKLLLVEHVNGPSIVSGNGDFQAQREQTFVLEGNHASVPVLVKIDGDDEDLAEYGFQLERLDLAEANAVVATVTPNQPLNLDANIIGSLVVQNGGLYRLSLLGPDNATFLGNTSIAIGSHRNLKEVDINRQPKFLAGMNGAMELTSSIAESDAFLSLSIPHQLNSHKLDWVLLSLDLEAWGSDRKAYTKRSVIAYSNDRTVQDDFRNDIETIPLPFFDGKQAFMLIVTHSAGDLECCSGAVGAGLIQLFQGLPEDNVVLIGTSFEGESRLVEIFHLDASSEAESTTSASFVGTAIVAGGLLLVCGYVVYRMCRN